MHRSCPNLFPFQLFFFFLMSCPGVFSLSLSLIRCLSLFSLATPLSTNYCALGTYNNSSFHWIRLLLLGGSTGGSHTHNSLEGVIDPPLQTSECTDHKHTGTETTEEELGHTLLRGHLTEGLTLVLNLTHLRNEIIGGCETRAQMIPAM